MGSRRGCVLLWLLAWVWTQAWADGGTQVVIDGGDTQSLIEAIIKANQNETFLVVFLGEGTYTFDGPFEDTDSALPPIMHVQLVNVSLLGMGDDFPVVTFVGGGENNRFRLAEVSGSLLLLNVKVEGFSNPANGGVLAIQKGADLEVRGCNFTGNMTDGQGGVIWHGGDGKLTIRDCEFRENSAFHGGAAYMDSAGDVRVIDNIFSGNSADFACDLSLGLQPGSTIDRNTFAGACASPFQVERRSGNVSFRFNTFQNLNPTNQNLWTLEVDPAYLKGNIFRTAFLGDAGFTPPACFQLHPGAIMSEGGNIANDDSCDLDGPNDLPGTEALLGPPDENGIVPLLPGSPAIDLVQWGLGKGALTELPCGYRDSRGLARPQDGDLDGDPACDAGSYEFQSGPDIGAAHSGAFFDTGRNGEGIFVEMLGGGLALVYVFTYTPDGKGQAWILGVGNVIGNSIVVDDMQITSGGIFGPGFDPDDVVRETWGGFSVNFPDCPGDIPGVMAFTGNEGMGYEPLLTRASRITSIVACPGVKKAAFIYKTGIDTSYSGSWFDPGHNGEGIILEVLNAITVVVQWFTYDDEGNQFWIQGVGTIDGKTVTVKEAFYTRGARWGSGFDPDDVERVDWGTITLTFSGCNTATMDYASVVAGFGSGTQNMSRITTLDGAACS